jgi:tetratricopeptide (TPR) repeat protein
MSGDKLPEEGQQINGLSTPSDQYTLSGDFRYATINIKSIIVDNVEAKSIEDLPPEPGDPPFQGLQYFSEEDAPRFFGREQIAARLVARLKTERFLAVVGASGSGKSSLIRAGVIPALRAGRPLEEGVLLPKDSPKWAMLTLTPGTHPLEALAAALSTPDADLSSIASLRDQLTQSPSNLSLAARKYLAQTGHPHLLLIVDQFEEVFTLCRHPEERKAFITALLDVVAGQDQAPLTVLVALRADYYADIARHDHLRLIVSEHQEFIGGMRREELVSAIDRPLALGNWKIQEGLIEVILSDIGYEPGALPLLSHALHETWQRRRGHTLTLSAYTESGGVRGAIAQTAESVFRSLPPKQQPVARMIFLRMAEISDDSHVTRRRATYAEMITRSTDELVLDAVINILADARLVTTSTLLIPQSESAGLGRGRVVEVAHEALIREWPSLRQWLEEDREGLILHQNLTEDAKDWVQMERHPGSLYRGPRLQRALDWASKNKDSLSLLDEEFLETSRRVAEKEAAQARHLAKAARLQRTLAGLAAILLVIVSYLVYTYIIDRPPVIMDGFYNIAIGEFGDIVADEGMVLHHLVADKLQREVRHNPNILIWSDGPELRNMNVSIGVISSQTRAERLEAAAKKAQSLNADMLIYASESLNQDETNSSSGKRLDLEVFLAPRLDHNYEDLQSWFHLDCSMLLEDTHNLGAVINDLDHCTKALAWIGVGLAEAYQGRSLEALEAFLKADDYHEDAVVVQFLIGREYLFLVDRKVVLEFVRAEFEQEAEYRFTRAIELDPNYRRAYIGLGNIYTRRAQRLFDELTHQPHKTNDAAQLVDKAVDLYVQAYDLSNDSLAYGLPVDSIAQLSLGRSYNLRGEILFALGDSKAAMKDFDLAILVLEQTLGPLEMAGHPRYLTFAYLHLAAAFHSRAYYSLIDGLDVAPVIQDLYHALQYYDLCINQAEVVQDRIIISDIVADICEPQWNEVKRYLDEIAGR